MRTPSGLLFHHVTTVLCAAVLFACAGGDVTLPPDGAPATLTIIDGDEQSGRVGDPLALPLLIEVTDSRGRPVEGVTVAFEFGSAGPGAAVVPVQKTTNADGQADARLVLGTTVGRQTGMARVIAPAGSQPVEAPFSAIAVSEDANSMAAAGGEDQSGHVLQPLSDRLVVEVTDGFGNPVAGVPITWEAVGGGSVSENLVPTDEDGRARVDRILGPTVGQQTTVASSEGLAGSPVTFVHTAVAGDAFLLTVFSGDDQTGEAGAQLPADLVARLIDSQGNGVPNTAITWVPAIGGGTPNPQNTTTDNDGYTSTQWTLGPALGDQRMDAVVSGVGVASFTATATAGAPASLFIRTQPSSTARNGIPFERQPIIQLRDPQGNDAATAGVQVTVSLNGGGELEGTTRQTTDALGRATFSDLAIAGDPGTRTLVFEAVGYAPVTSDEIAVAAIGTTTTITGDSPDPSQVGTPFTVSFRVASEGPTPTGSVIVGDGAQSCTGALSNGAGSCQLTLSTVGQRTLTATYSGAPGLSGSSDTEPHLVTAAPPPPNQTPNADFTWTCEGFTCQFTDASSDPDGNVVGWRWDFGDGTSSIDRSPSHTFPTGGSYTVTLTVTDDGGATDASSATVAVQAPPPGNQAPTASFNPPSCTAGQPCQFSDDSNDSDGRVVSWSWNFGPGGTSTDRNPRPIFPAAGTFEVALTVTDDDGASSTVGHDVTVTDVPPPPNEEPDADYDSRCEDQTCQFTDASDDDDGNVVGWSWDFDDGTSSTDQNPLHRFPAPGTYSVTLTVTDDDGATDARTAEVRVSADNQAPTAAFTAECTELDCAFNSQSDDPDGSIEDYAWTFGDGGTSNDDDPGHEYQNGGTYQVTLTVTDNDGASNTTIQSVTVAQAPPTNQPPAAGDDAAATNPGEAVTISVLQNDTDPEESPLTVSSVTQPTNGTATAIGDGTITYTPNAGFAGSNDQFTYTVSDGELSDEATVDVTVNPAPNQAPSAVIGSISCTGMDCTFTDTSTDPEGDETIGQWNWIFGDGESSTGRNPTHAYATPADYEVRLTVTDDRGLSDDAGPRTVTVSDQGGGGGGAKGGALSRVPPRYRIRLPIDRAISSAG